MVTRSGARTLPCVGLVNMAARKSAALSRRPHPRAVVLAEHGEAPVKLTSGEKVLLDEALRRGEDLREQVAANVTSYGRWLLGAVFGDDASAALDDKSSNSVWRELAARDKRIADTTWRDLDAGRRSCSCRSATTPAARAEVSTSGASWGDLRVLRLA